MKGLQQDHHADCFHPHAHAHPSIMSTAVLQSAVRTSILNPTILLFSPSMLCTYGPKIRPSFFPFVSWELGWLFPFLSVLAASGKSTPLPPPPGRRR
jgi:hypothetical protein